MHYIVKWTDGFTSNKCTFRTYKRALEFYTDIIDAETEVKVEIFECKLLDRWSSAESENG